MPGTCSTAETFSGFSRERLIDDLLAAQKLIPDPPKSFDFYFNGSIDKVPIKTGDLVSTTKEPVKKHKKRSNQSVGYHLRIQKKWIKRYGEREVQRVYLINTQHLNMSFMSAGKEYLMVNPKSADRMDWS